MLLMILTNKIHQYQEICRTTNRVLWRKVLYVTAVHKHL